MRSRSFPAEGQRSPGRSGINKDKSWDLSSQGPFLWLIFGFFVTDIINEFKLFHMREQWYTVMGPVILLFGLQEAVLMRMEIKRVSSTEPEFIKSRWFKIF